MFGLQVNLRTHNRQTTSQRNQHQLTHLDRGTKMCVRYPLMTRYSWLQMEKHTQ